MIVATPSAEFQLDFLFKLQRIMDEGNFNATYKFALLIALAELAVESGSDDDRPLPLSTRAVGEKFAELYWKQIVPYSANGRALGMLSQIYSDAAAVPAQLAAFRAETGLSLAAARKHEGWQSVISSITRTVRAQPIRYLQNVGGQTVDFLYEIGPGPGTITLLPGVAYALRRFQGFVVRLAQGGWVRHVRKNPRNRVLIGEAGDLEAFMFEQSRQTLAAARRVLAEAQVNRCFYCEHRVTGVGAVDHFIPWVRYPRDLAENFVFACAACNRSKSDMLANASHRKKWTERNRIRGQIIDGLASVGLVSDRLAIEAVARWAYGDTVRMGARLWP